MTSSVASPPPALSLREPRAASSLLTSSGAVPHCRWRRPVVPRRRLRGAWAAGRRRACTPSSAPSFARAAPPTRNFWPLRANCVNLCVKCCEKATYESVISSQRTDESSPRCVFVVVVRQPRVRARFHRRAVSFSSLRRHAGKVPGMSARAAVPRRVAALLGVDALPETCAATIPPRVQSPPSQRQADADSLMRRKHANVFSHAAQKDANSRAAGVPQGKGTPAVCPHGIFPLISCLVCAGCPHGLRVTRCPQCMFTTDSQLGQGIASSTVAERRRQTAALADPRSRKLGARHADKPSAVVPCAHRWDRRCCRECDGSFLCAHGLQRTSCAACGGGAMCEHGLRRIACGKCDEANVGNVKRCAHGNLPLRCAECRRCRHGVDRRWCRKCSAHRYCAHGRLESSCIACNQNYRARKQRDNDRQRDYRAKRHQAKRRWRNSQKPADTRLDS